MARICITGITPGTPAVSYPASWVGTAANTLRFSKSTGANTLDWAYARTDHQNISGQGAISSLSFNIPAGTAGQKIILILESVKIIAANGAAITACNVLSDTITVIPLGVPAIPSLISNAAIAPNPSPGAAALSFSRVHPEDVEIIITDITGRAVRQSRVLASGTGMQEVALPAALKSGVYLVQLKAAGTSQVMKWVRE